MKRIALLVAALAMMLGAATTPAGASAATADAVPATCDGNRWLDYAYVYPPGGTLPWGRTDLCWDGSKAYTIFIHYNANGVPATMPANYKANAWVYRYDPWPQPAGTASCDGPDGNGYVKPGETWCRSHRLAPLSARTVWRGTTFVYHKNASTGNWDHVASGWTWACDRYGNCIVT